MSTYVPIYTTTLGSNQGSIAITGIPTTYTDLILVCRAKRAIGGSGAASLTIQFNAEFSGTNYSSTLLYGASSTHSANTNNIVFGATAFDGNTPAFCMSTVHIFNYANTTAHKTTLSRFGDPNLYSAQSAGSWRNTAAINRIDLSAANSIAAGSSFTLYGIKAA
jgi:hypothetical protein